MAIDFADRRISMHAGTATFLRLAACERICLGVGKSASASHASLQQQSDSRGKGVGFLRGSLCKAHKLTHAACRSCGQPIYPVPAFIAGCSGVADNANNFRWLWNGTINHLPGRREGYTLVWDSAKLLHRGGNQ
jgi:hypothetical protein